MFTFFFAVFERCPWLSAMDGVFGDSQEDEDAAEDELEFFKYVQDEVLEAKILNMTTVPGPHKKKMPSSFG